jgi:hypothetical protein
VAEENDNIEDVSHEPQKMTCPKCGSIDIRPSRKSNFFGYFLVMMGRQPFRCRSCRVKFYRRPEAHGLT